MAKNVKLRGSDAKLARLRTLRNVPISAETLKELAGFLGDASNVVTAEAAALIGSGGGRELTADLVAAFERLMIDPEDTDKQCLGKIAIIQALDKIEYCEPDVFVRGITHVQDPRFGDSSQDAAGALRAQCALSLARIGHRGVLALLTELLLDSDDTARAGAARALGGTGSLAAVPLLRYKILTGDRNADVLGECFASLLDLAADEAVPFVARFLRHGNDAVKGAAVFALAETRRPDAFTLLTDYWPVAPADVREAVLLGIAMFRQPAALDFLVGIVAGKDPYAKAALSALAIHKHNPKIKESVAAAVQANGEAVVLEWFKKKFPD